MSSLSSSPTAKMPSPPRSNASRRGLRRVPSRGSSRNRGLPVAGLRPGACARRDCPARSGRDSSTSTIATGVFCTIVSSSSSRCTSDTALLAQRVAERVVRVDQFDQVAVLVPGDAETEIAVAIARDRSGQGAEQRAHRRHCAPQLTVATSAPTTSSAGDQRPRPMRAASWVSSTAVEAAASTTHSVRQHDQPYRQREDAQKVHRRPVAVQSRFDAEAIDAGGTTLAATSPVRAQPAPERRRRGR